MKVIEKYLSFDGKEFSNKDECAAYEQEHSESLLCGLDDADIAGALDGTNSLLGDAIERMGRKIAQARIERGERKRKAKQKVQAPTTIDGSATQTGGPA